jgi:hypothetical protein
MAGEIPAGKPFLKKVHLPDDCGGLGYLGLVCGLRLLPARPELELLNLVWARLRSAGAPVQGHRHPGFARAGR